MLDRLFHGCYNLEPQEYNGGGKNVKQSVRNEKPRVKVAASTQGRDKKYGNGNSTTFKAGKSRHDKGMELYKTGRVSIGANGLFKVSGYYEADTEKMVCTCPDFKTRKEPCKHLYAACLFVKNRGKQGIEDFNGEDIRQRVAQSNGKEDSVTRDTISKPFDRQSTITRLAVLNTATEILKTHNKPIRSEDLFKVASQLEKWALGGE